MGQHCKGRQQVIIKTTKNKVRGYRQMALLAYLLKWACHHKAWEVQKTSKRDVQTNSVLTSQGKEQQALDWLGSFESSLLSMDQACWADCKPYTCSSSLRAPESRARNITSRPELAPSVTAKGGRGEKPQTGDGLDTTASALVRGQVWLSGPTVGTNHGKATKKHRRSVVLASPKYVLKVQMNRFHMQTRGVELKTFKYESSYNLSYN